MSRLVALGAAGLVRGFGLAGATVLEVTDAAEARAAWDRLPGDTAVLILTEATAEALRERLPERPRLLWVVMPA